MTTGTVGKSKMTVELLPEEVDVLIVGAGAAGMTASLPLSAQDSRP